MSHGYHTVLTTARFLIQNSQISIYPGGGGVRVAREVVYYNTICPQKNIERGDISRGKNHTTPYTIA